jgi:hypothetical protein
MNCGLVEARAARWIARGPVSAGGGSGALRGLIEGGRRFCGPANSAVCGSGIALTPITAWARSRQGRLLDAGLRVLALHPN